MKGITRRQLIFEAFTKDTMKSIAGAYKEFTKASNETPARNCDEVARMFGKKAQKYSKKFFQQKRKEG